MSNPEVVVDCFVLEDSGKAFFSLMTHDKAQEIQANGGLANAEQINLRETTERPIPDSIKQGISCIQDILVKIEPNQMIYLN